VIQGRNHIARLDVAQLDPDGEPIEEVLLRELGAGTYRLIPLYRDEEGKRAMRPNQTLELRVGRPGLQIIATQQTDSFGTPLSSGPDWKAILEALSPLGKELLGLVRSDQLHSLESALALVERLQKRDPVVEDLLQKALANVSDPSRAIRDVRALMREVQQDIPQRKNNTAETLAALTQLAPLAGEALGQLGVGLGRAFGGGRKQAVVVEEPAPALAGNVPVAPAERKPTTVQILVLNQANRIAAAKDPERLVDALVSSYHLSQSLGMQDEIITAFQKDPLGTFDWIAARTPNLDEQTRDAARALLKKEVEKSAEEDAADGDQEETPDERAVV
jgi:hypothetical protein